MSQFLSSQSSIVPRPGAFDVSFGRSADGMLVARVGDHAFAMVPTREGRHYLATGWRIRRPMAEWTGHDFFGHSGGLPDEAVFRAKVLEQAVHFEEQAALGRREVHSKVSTPWGPSQSATIYADGVICHSTSGHGGFFLAPERNAMVHPMLRADDGFYEEDECWAVVAITFPDLFTGLERRCAEQTAKDSFPDAWEAISGMTLGPGESRTKDRRTFEAKHADDWIVISAITSEQNPGFVECIATLGGGRGQDPEDRRFLVPSAEYAVGQFGFVIDFLLHATYEGPSSFAGCVSACKFAPQSGVIGVQY